MFCNRHNFCLTSLGMIIAWVTSCSPSPTEVDLEEAQVAEAARFVEQLGGKIEADLNNVKRPIVGVNLKDTPINDQGLKQLKAFKDLRSLNLYGSKITEEGIGELKDFEALRVLTLTGTASTDLGLSKLVGMNSLHELDIGHYSPASEVGFANLKELSALKKLGVSYSEFNDRALEAICCLENMEDLCLNKTKITDEGLVHLKKMKKLRRLQIGQCAITDAGMEYLKEIKTLKMLIVGRTQVTEQGKQMLQSVIPSIRFTY